MEKRQPFLMLSNAIKFTKTGHVHVDARLERGSEYNWIRFDVEDTGIGIEADKREAIRPAGSFPAETGSNWCRH